MTQVGIGSEQFSDEDPSTPARGSGTSSTRCLPTRINRCGAGKVSRPTERCRDDPHRLRQPALASLESSIRTCVRAVARLAR